MDFNGYLMSGDKVLSQIQNGYLLQMDHPLLPLYLASGGDLEEWLTSRAIDRHRPNSRILKKILRLTDSSDVAAVLRAHAATITDNYWVKRDSESELTYEQIKFTEDSFAEVALTGSFSSYTKQYTEAQLKSNSPELTNIGSYEKCWRIKDGEWWLYKTGNQLERFSELFIAGLGKLLGFDMAEYLPHDTFIKTRDFTKGVFNFEPASSIVGEEEDYEFNYDRLTALSPNLGKQFLDILCMDALCFNVDRHTKNYGVLRSQSTGEIIGMAPNFDNNIALISRGYGPDPTATNGILIDMFVELLAAKNLAYSLPPLDSAALRELAESTLPGESIDRNYVVAMITERWQRTAEKISML